MNNKKLLIVGLISIIMLTSFNKVNSSINFEENAIFMGTVIEVSYENKDIIRVKMKGYIKNCNIYQEEIVGIIDNETIFLQGECGMNIIEKNNIKINDIVYVKLNKVMTASIPPQSLIEEIQINRLQ